MSSNCPPQLQLSIQPNTTTFKTTFEQFGFHLDSPVGGTDAGGSAVDTGNDRNKRARSSSSLSQSSDTSDASRNTASTLGSGIESSSDSSREDSSGIVDEFPVIVSTARSAIDPPPRLPTPVIQDIDMAEVLPENDPESTGAPLPTPQQTEDSFRLSMARFNAFENEIALLRGSQPLSPARTRSPTPPPTLPPLSIVSSSDQHVHQRQTSYHLLRATPPDVNFFRHLPPRSPSPFLDHFLNETETTPSIITDDVASGEEISASEHHGPQEGSSFQNAMYRFRTNSLPMSAPRRDQHQQRPPRGPDESAEEDNQVFSGFRDRLNTALQRLRPASPLVPGLEDSVDGVGNEVAVQAEEEMQEEVDGNEGQNRNSEHDTSSSYRSTTHTLPPDPPTLPPIPPIAADTDADDWRERPLIDDSMETYIPSSESSQDELEERVVRETMQQNVRHFLSLSSSSSSGWPPPSSSSSSISGNPSLRDLPLPSPILRDLHSWMQERGPFGEGSTINTSASEQLAASATVSQSNAANSHSDQRQPIPTGAETSQSSTSSGGAARVNEWNAYSSFSPASAPGSSGLASAEGSSSSASTSGTAQEPTGSNSFPTPASSISNSRSLANTTTSVSYSRNMTDEAAVRSFDHGVGMGLGFGPGAARPMPSAMSSGQSPTPSRNDGSDSEQRPRNDSSTLTSTANGLGQPPTHRPITSRVSFASWPSWARESGMGPLPDLDLDFSSMAGTAGSSLSSPSMSDDWRSDAFTAAPPGDRPAAVRGSPPTTTTSIPLDDSFLESTMTSLDIFPTTAAPGPGPRPENSSTSANNFRQTWSELHASASSSSSSSHEHQHLLRSRMRQCPHNPRCVYIPGAQLSHTGAGPSTTPNASTSDFERPHSELRRRLDTRNADRYQEHHRRWLMDSDSDSDSLPLPNRIPSNSRSLLNRLHNINRTMDPTLSNPSQYRRLASSAAHTESSQSQPTVPQPRLRTAHSQARLGSTTSLASETAFERRRLEDHAAIARARAIRALSNSSRAPDAEAGINAANTRSGLMDGGDVDERGLRRVQEAWDEIRAMHRQLHRSVSADRAQNAEMNATDTRSSFDRLVQNAWQNLDNPDISLSSPEDEPPAWLAGSPPTSATAAPSAASEDVDMSFTGGAMDAHDAYWRTFLRDLGIENPFDPGHRPSSSTSQNRREGRDSDPYGLGWPDNSLNNDNRSSGTASSSTSPTDEGSPFIPLRLTPYATLAERNLPTIPTRDATDANIERTPRRFPLNTYGRVPSLPSPDLGGSFSAEQAAQTVLASGVLTSRHLSGMLNRNQNFATHGNHGIGPSHYQHQPAAPPNSISNSNQARHVRPPRHVSLTAAHIPPPEPAPEWDSMMDTTEDNSTDNSLFASMLEDREHIAQLTARHQARIATLRRASNLAEFAPGPFRNTLQHSLDQQHASRRRVGYAPSIPPSIPPLSFEDNNFASLRNTGPSADLRTPEEASLSPIGIPFQTSREMPARREQMRALRPGAPAAPEAYSHPATSRSFASARAEAHRARAQNELFLLNRQMRMEASRSGDPPTQRGGPANGSLDLGDMEPAPFRRQTIEAMRNRYRSRYGTVAENLAHANRSPMYPGSMDDDEIRESASFTAARIRRNRIQFPHEMIMFARGGATRRGRPLGDFMRDEDFDESYESLLSLAQTLGDVKPRSTPAEVIEKMEKAQYKDWATADSDQRCPICLDDYNPTDPVLKLSNCSHWLHQECLQQWLQTANTCPVCRKSVSTSTGFRRSHVHTHHHRVNPFGGFARREPPPPAPSAGPSEGGSASNGNAGNNPTQPSSNPGHHHQYHHSHYHHGFPPAPWRRGPPPA